MNLITNRAVGPFVVWVALFLCGCQSSSEVPEGSGGTMGLGGENPGEVLSCDEFSEEHDALLNAPTDAVVVRKSPNVPKSQ